MDESRFGQPNQPEQKKPVIELTVSQQEVADAILEVLKKPPMSHSRIILVEGLSGVGKTAVLEHIEPQLGQYQAVIVDSDYGVSEDIKETRKKTRAKNFIVPVLASKTIETSKELSKTKADIEVKRISGLGQQETEELAQKLVTGKNLKLPLEKIIYYSMGVPLLLQRLIYPEITEEMAIGIVADYVRNNAFSLHGENIKVQDFLKMPVPPELQDYFDRMGFRIDFYKRLPFVLDRWEEAKERDSNIESPFFIAPESVDIYNKMFEGSDPFVEIYATGLSPENKKRFKNAFPHQYDESRSRFRMFGGIYRKIRIESGGQVIYDTEGYEESKYFPKKGAPGSVYFLKYDHPGTPGDTTIDSWAVESFLQQRGIAYKAHNALYGKNYRFNPETKHIEFIDDKTE